MVKGKLCKKRIVGAKKLGIYQRNLESPSFLLKREKIFVLRFEYRSL